LGNVTPKLIIIIGLPGSGKFCYLEDLCKKREVQYIYDDFHANAFNDSRKVVGSQHFCALISHLKNGEDCAISDVAFCKNTRLKEVIDETMKEAKDVKKIELIYFKNEPENCIQNIKARNRKSSDKEINLVGELTGAYKIPDGAKQVPVFKK